MTCAVTHFIPIENWKGTPYYLKIIPDSQDEHCLLWYLCQVAYDNMMGADVEMNNYFYVFLVPVLPHMTTSTDETTFFISKYIIHNKPSWYLMVRPVGDDANRIGSQYRNAYSTNMHGDSHLRGLRVVLNQTFTAGGTTAPTWITIYGFNELEMPFNDIVVIEVPGLCTAGDQCLSQQIGYICFVRGKGEIDTTPDLPETVEEDDDDHLSILSKESRVAKIYRERVYHPFITKLRQIYYNYEENEDEPVPDWLTAVSWMDGANAQLKLMTTETCLEKEQKMKIVTN